jgi:putative ABC transport system permease protein
MAPEPDVWYGTLARTRRAIRAWLRRVTGSFGGLRRDRALADELDAHLAFHIDDHIRAGLSPAEARRSALLQLGGLDQTKEACRDRRGLPAVDHLVKDVAFALRLMRRSPGFTATVLATLAVGIGANTVMFSIVNTVLLRPLPYAEPSELVFVQSVDAASRSRTGFTAAPDFYTYRAQNRTLARLDAFYTPPVNLTGGLQPERAVALTVSSGFLATLGIQPAHGRGFVMQDEQWGSHRVAVLGDGLWRRRFAGDPAVVGRTIAINGDPYVVVGILPPAFSFLGLDAQLLLPLSFEPGDNMNSHNNYFLRMVGRLGRGVTSAQAAADLNRILEAIIAETSVNGGTAIAVAPFRDVLVGDVRRPVLVLLGAVGFVLLIACANLANLLLARAVVRQREIAVRLALGATRGRLFRQLLIESLLLAFAGGLAGLGVAYLAADAVNVLSPRVLARAEDVRVDGMVLVFTFTVAVLTGILLGVAPALQGMAADVNEGLKDKARGDSTSGRGHRLHATLVVAEVALALVLLAGAGLMVKSLYQLLHVDAGFEPENVLTMQVNIPARRYVDRELARQLSPRAYVRATALYTEIVDRVRTIPGVRAAGAINGLPLMGEVWGKNIRFFDRPLPADVRGLSSIQYRVVAGDYFAALGIRIRSGRAFTDRDALDAPNVAIVNRELVRRYWDNRDPIGQIISVNPPLELLPASVVEQARRAGQIPEGYEPARFTVVGVAEDARYGGLHAPAVPLVYVPYAQGSEGETNMFLAVRTDGDPLAIVGAVREEIARVDRDQPVAAIQTMEARRSASVAQRRLQVNVLGAFAGLAILLAAIGIYGVMSYAVAARAPELAIRLALGATGRDVVALVLRRGFASAVLGIAIGVGAALLLTRVLRSLLFGVTATDPQVFVTIVLLLSATAWLAAYLPARRASALDPLATLRHE